MVVGDLVYCKENHTETAAVQNSEEYVDEDCGDANSYDSCHLEEMCKLDLPTERNKLVKVGGSQSQRLKYAPRAIFTITYYCRSLVFEFVLQLGLFVLGGVILY